MSSSGVIPVSNSYLFSENDISVVQSKILGCMFEEIAINLKKNPKLVEADSHSIVFTVDTSDVIAKTQRDKSYVLEVAKHLESIIFGFPDPVPGKSTVDFVYVPIMKSVRDVSGTNYLTMTINDEAWKFIVRDEASVQINEYTGVSHLLKDTVLKLDSKYGHHFYNYLSALWENAEKGVGEDRIVNGTLKKFISIGMLVNMFKLPVSYSVSPSNLEKKVFIPAKLSLAVNSELCAEFCLLDDKKRVVKPGERTSKKYVGIIIKKDRTITAREGSLKVAAMLKWLMSSKKWNDNRTQDFRNCCRSETALDIMFNEYSELEGKVSRGEMTREHGINIFTKDMINFMKK